MKDCRSLVLRSPLVIAQMILMCLYVVCATREALTQFNFYATVAYSISMVVFFVLAIGGMLNTFLTHPGEVNKQLIEKIKSQLMHPKQFDKLYDVHGTKQRTDYIVRCLNRAILRHIQCTYEMGPGQMPIAQQEDDIELLDTAHLTSAQQARMREDAKQVPQICRFGYCEPCGRIQPPRAEHCTLGCDCCVMRLDHHCVWMGNCCVGFLNHKFYILYLLYLTIGCVLTTIPFADQCLFQSLGFLELIELDWLGTWVFFSACAFTLFLGCMLILQLRYLLRNQTNYEHNISAKIKPFKQKSIVRNLQKVFGPRKRSWWSPFVHPFPLDEAMQHNEYVSAIVPSMHVHF